MTSTYLRTLALLLCVSFAANAEATTTTITVTSTASDRGTFTELQCLPPGSDVDAGPGSTTITGGATLAAAQADAAVTLREAICVANNTAKPVVIELSPTTYTLTTADNYWYGPNGLPPIGNDITIEGNGAVIERDSVLFQRFRFFFVSRKTLTDGIAIVGGVDRAQLTLRDLTLRGGLAQGGTGQAGGGGGGMGGAIFNQGTLALERVTFDGNTARGGESGTGSFWSDGRGAGMGWDATGGGGFGPGLFGGALGGSAFFDANAVLVRYGCGGGAGFGTAAGGDALLRQINTAGNSAVFAGAGGGLGNVGGSNPTICVTGDLTDCAGAGRDGGGGGTGGIENTASGNGQGGSFGLNGSTASDCGGGGGAGAGGAPGSIETGLQGGAGGFGGGGGSRTVGTAGPPNTALGGAGGFGGGGGSGYDPGGDQSGVSGPGGFGAGSGGLAKGIASGGGGAGMGGALFNHGGEVNASNTTWTDNRAIGGSVELQNNALPGAGMGGAIFNLDGVLDIGYSTLSGNRVERGEAISSARPNTAGGAVYNRVQNPGVYGFVSQVTIRASILADSLDGEGSPISDCNHSAHPDAGFSSALSAAESVVFENLATIADVEDHLACSSGTGSVLADPLLHPLADNGGLTPTMAIGIDSPARDAAGNCADPVTDQRGIARPQGTACDAGAFELVVCPAGGVIHVDHQAAAGGNGETWAAALSDLQDALAVADDCEIWVTAGVYKPTTDPSERRASFILKNGVAIYGGFAGTETARDQRDPQLNVTVLSGDIDNNDIIDPNGVVVSPDNIVGANSYNVTVGSGIDATAILDGFTITGGLANDETFGFSQVGAGMIINFGSPTLSRLRFSGNRANKGGGGLFNVGFSGPGPTLTRVSFIGNRTDDAGGGGMSNNSSNPIMDQVSFIGNRASADGGGLFTDKGDPMLTNVSFNGNRSGNRGGGLFIEEGSITLINASFSGNRADFRGGGLYNRVLFDDASVIGNSIFWNNQDNSGTGTPTASIFAGNTATTQLSYSLVQGCNPGGIWEDACGTDGGSNLADADPLFVTTPDPMDAPTGNGNLRLEPGSPAIDSGDNNANDSSFDLDGNPRISNGVIDLGPYEYIFDTIFRDSFWQ